jgi:very-short-patch-repair endonuclease
MSPTGVEKASIMQARRLRRGMTVGERRLWSELREFRRLYGIHVRKQAPIGPYIADFVIHEHKRVIELDGEHHFTPLGIARDRLRDQWLESQGFSLLRIGMGDQDGNIEGIVDGILHRLELMGDRPGSVDLAGKDSGRGSLSHD